MENTKEFNPKDFLHTIVIIDASVLLKPFLGEDAGQKVKELVKMAAKKQLTLLATQLLSFEFINTLAKKISDPAIVTSAVEKLRRFGVGILNPGRVFDEEAIESTCKHQGVSYYDASYHALARDMGGVFLTADKKYYEEMKHLGSIALFT